jgi:hypothetical protein
MWAQRAVKVSSEHLEVSDAHRCSGEPCVRLSTPIDNVNGKMEKPHINLNFGSEGFVDGFKGC